MAVFKFVARALSVLLTLLTAFFVLMFLVGGGGHSVEVSTTLLTKVLSFSFYIIFIITVVSSWRLSFLKKWALYPFLFGIFICFLLSMYGSQSIFWSSGDYPLFYPYIIPALLAIIGIYFYANKKYLY